MAAALLFGFVLALICCDNLLFSLGSGALSFFFFVSFFSFAVVFLILPLFAVIVKAVAVSVDSVGELKSFSCFVAKVGALLCFGFSVTRYVVRRASKKSSFSVTSTRSFQ